LSTLTFPSSLLAQTPCISTSFTLPIRLSILPAQVGFVSVELQADGLAGMMSFTNKLDNITAPATGTLSVQQANIQRDVIPAQNMQTKRQQTIVAENVAIPVCGTTWTLESSLTFRDVDGNQFTGWAVPPSSGLLPGMTFTPFVSGGFAGMFTLKFCQCTCCFAKAGTVPFTCPSGTCLDAKGVRGPNCPPVGPQLICPLPTFFNPNSPCFCGNTITGGEACFSNATLQQCKGAKKCTKAADCPSGTACHVKSCCLGDTICAPLCPLNTNCHNT